MINVLGEDQLKPPVKRCVYCHEEKTLDKFPKHELYPSVRFEIDYLGKDINEIPALKHITS